MSLREYKTDKPSAKINLRIVHKKGLPVDEQEIWQALVDAFRKHPTLDVFQAKIGPDKDETN